MPVCRSSVGHSAEEKPGAQAGAQTRQQPRACRQLCSSFASDSSSRTTQSSLIYMSPVSRNVGCDSRTTIYSTVSGEDGTMGIVDDGISASSWPTATTRTRTSNTTSPAMSIISLNTTTSSASTSTSSFSPSESSDRPRLAPVCTTGHWAHLPPPPGYIPDRDHKTSYNARQRLAHLEADEFCTNVRITAVLCLGCSNDIALDARFVMYPCLWLKHRRTCVGVQMLAMGFDPVSRV
ncbi:hypothetical protein C8F01DRAFT_690107 [Mycena amicta]|nr:hypothetical protein C8F01DRAFT_690107 [Mycena amicta]